MASKKRPFGAGTRKGGFDSVATTGGRFHYNQKVEIETGQRKGKDFWLRPTGGTVNQRGPFYFTIEANENHYLQLNRSRLEMILRVTKGNGQPLKLYEDIVAPVNLLGSTLWENVEVSVNNQPFSGASSVNAGIKAYMDTLLSYDFDARHTHLLTSFMHPDTPNAFETMKIPTERFRKALEEDVRADIIPVNQISAANRDVIKEIYTKRSRIVNSDNITATTQNQLDAIETEFNADQKSIQTIINTLITTHFLEPFVSGTYYDKESPLPTKNLGFETRCDIIENSQSFQIYAPIPHDFFNVNNHIGPGNKIDIKLERYPDNFLLNTNNQNADYKLVIVDMKLHLHAIERRESIPRPIVERYRMNETQLHKYVIGANMPSAQIRIVHGGVLPKTIIVGMVLTQAIEGSYILNPFNFNHFSVAEMYLNKNGDELPANGGLRFDFDEINPFMARGYHWLFENTGAWQAEKGNCISYEAFQGGSFIIPFDLTPDRCNGLHDHAAEYGFIDLYINFDVEIPYPVTVLYELTYSKMVVNDKGKNQLSILDIE